MGERDAGCGMRDAGCGMQDAGCGMQDFEVKDAAVGCSAPQTHRWFGSSLVDVFCFTLTRHASCIPNPASRIPHPPHFSAFFKSSSRNLVTSLNLGTLAG